MPIHSLCSVQATEASQGPQPEISRLSELNLKFQKNRRLEMTRVILTVQFIFAACDSVKLLVKKK